MRPQVNHKVSRHLNERLATSGFRFTPQRQHVYDVLLSDLDHPTAEEVFMRAKKTMPEISFATVYNCLDALVTCGLVRQVSLDRAASRFCPNMEDHGHFYCEECGAVFDVEVAAEACDLPEGFIATHRELSFRGTCPKCTSSK